MRVTSGARMPHGPLAVAVLKLLDERPMHPYEMLNCIRDRRLDMVFKLKTGSLYHTVERLERAGLIAPLETNREGRRPERTVYAITEAGGEEFRLWLRDMIASPAQEYPQFAAALASVVHLDAAEVLKLLQYRAVALEAEVAGGERVLEGMEATGLERIHLLEYDYSHMLRRAELAWVRMLIADLQGGRLTWPDIEAYRRGQAGEGGKEGPE